MMIRLHIPVNLYVLGRTQESLEVQTTFSHEGFVCSLRMTGTPPLSSDNLPEESRHFRQALQLQLTLSEGPQGDALQSLIESRAYQDLVALLRPVANRCLRGIRNFGIVPHLHELRDRQREDYETTLRGWDVDFSHDGEEWESVTTEPQPFALLTAALAGGSQGQEIAELRADRWPEIEEAIQDDLPPQSEQEFTTNAIEHLRLKNFRLAVVESIIGLEIVFTRYLTEYLRVHKGTPKDRIKDFLSPNFTLTTRLAGILDLTLDPKDLKIIDLRKVMAAVRWRNEVTHRTGHLPKGLSDKAIIEGIAEVLTLTNLLSYRAQQVSASPEIRDISDYISKRHNLSRPRLWFLENHRVLAEFEVFRLPAQAFPSAEELNAAITDIIERLRARDARFRPEEHLHVRFFEFPRKLRARWQRGDLELTEGE